MQSKTDEFLKIWKSLSLAQLNEISDNYTKVYRCSKCGAVVEGYEGMVMHHFGQHEEKGIA